MVPDWPGREVGNSYQNRVAVGEKPLEMPTSCGVEHDVATWLRCQGSGGGHGQWRG